jgi:hypothetical protein
VADPAIMDGWSANLTLGLRQGCPLYAKYRAELDGQESQALPGRKDPLKSGQKQPMRSALALASLFRKVHFRQKLLEARIGANGIEPWVNAEPIQAATVSIGLV